MEAPHPHWTGWRPVLDKEVKGPLNFAVLSCRSEQDLLMDVRITQSRMVVSTGLGSTKEICWCKGRKRMEELGTHSENPCLGSAKNARRQGNGN